MSDNVTVIDHDKVRDLAQEIADEFLFARDMFPPMHSAHEGYAVILEELDELWTEVKNDKKPDRRTRMRAEALQVGAMALAFVLEVCDGRG